MSVEVDATDLAILRALAADATRSEIEALMHVARIKTSEGLPL